MAIKRTFIEALQRLPDDATLDDVLDQIQIILKVERGITAGERDEVSLEEAREEAKNWASE